MSTATPDENDGRESGRTGADAATGAGGDTAADTVVTTPATSEDGPSRSSDGGGRSADQAAGGPPPPWQRAGTRSESSSRAESGAGSSEGEQRSRPSPGPGGQRPPTPAAGTPRPSPSGPPPSGPFPAPGGQRPGPPPSGPTPAPGQQRRSNTALIDAPTNQLSPEQLGMRVGERSEPEPELEDIEEDVPTARRSPRGKVPRRASLQVKRFDPWSVLKLALVLGVALFFVWMFAVGVLYAVLDGMGVWAQLNGTYQDLTSDAGGGGQLITAGGVFGVAAIVGVVNTILFTAIASVSAFIYNISADVAGGIEVTLSERD
ncbi:DUF3566 domain-containing protein [Actinomycetospora sp.]|uniref:DUF3566 domain-containing protein n=1 Tax=Actinomycetospora sp. TaxID=1872135 RepID=UPI0039C85C03